MIQIKHIVSLPRVPVESERSNEYYLTHTISQKIIDNLSQFYIENLAIPLPENATVFDKLDYLFAYDPRIIDAISTSLDATKRYIANNKQGFRDITSLELALLGKKRTAVEEESRLGKLMHDDSEAGYSILEYLMPKPELFSREEIQDTPYLRLKMPDNRSAPNVINGILSDYRLTKASRMTAISRPSGFAVAEAAHGLDK